MYARRPPAEASVVERWLLFQILLECVVPVLTETKVLYIQRFNKLLLSFLFQI